MKTTRNVLLALLLAGSTAGIASAQISISAGIQIGSGGRAAVDLGFFYDNLASYGNWIERPSYGWVWTPRDVSTSWRPYQDGHWVWTDQGWTWITDEPYGWATYHYGRWYQDPEIGWSWVPGNDWAPAWVDWQEGNDYVGWAPLPPSYDINASYDSSYGDGYNNSYDNGYNNGYAGSYGGGYNRYGILASSYVFVQERYILAPRIVEYVVPVQQVVTILPRTRSYTHYRQEGDRFINQGIPVERVQQVVGRPVPRYQIADMQSGYQQRAARIQGNRLEIFRPQVRQAQVAPPVSRPAARQAVVSAQQFQVAHPNRAQRFQRENPQAVGQTPPGQRQRNMQPGRGQFQGDQGRQVQGGQPDRQGRQYNGQYNGQQQPQDRRQVRPYDPQQPDPNQAGRQQRQTEAERQQQLDRANRQRQYDPQRQDQVQPDRQRPNDAQRQQQQQDRANRQRQYDPQRQDQGQADRQRQNDAQHQQQQQDQANRQRQQDAQQQQDRANRQRQYDPQRQDQGQADRQRQNDAQRQQQQDRARQRQDDPQRPPQAEQRQPPPNRNGDNQGQTQEQRNQARKQREQERKKNQDQNQDDHRPPQRR